MHCNWFTGKKKAFCLHISFLWDRIGFVFASKFSEWEYGAFERYGSRLVRFLGKSYSE